MIERDGDEVAGATSLVRYAPNTRFTTHPHDLGKAIFVVDSVFEEAHGRYPKSYWLRNPHMSAHKPFSVEGCTI